MSHKDQLVTTALLGTEQQAIPDFVSSGQLAQRLTQLNDLAAQLGRERTLLHASAIVSLVEKAGLKLPIFEGQLTSPCALEKKPAVQGVSLSHLKSLLDSQQDLLPEWLEIAAQLNKRIPDECLVGMLQMAAQHSSLRPLVIDCLGTRGRWLAQFNPDWSFVNSNVAITETADITSMQKLFDFGSIDERCSALAAIRRLDGAKGLELVRSSWKVDRPEDRVRFLAILKTDLSIDDEPFLETEALDDKRKEVRQKARECLFELPQSRFSRRAEERALACLNKAEGAKGGPLSNIIPLNKSKAQVRVTVPDECDKSMVRDGIVAKPIDTRMGEKAWWLSQIVEQVNPNRILEHLDMTGEQFLEALSVSEWHTALRQGLTEAVVRFRDRPLAKMLLHTGRFTNNAQLFNLLDSNEQEGLLTKLLADSNFILLSQVQGGNGFENVAILLAMKHRWSTMFSQTMLKTLRTHMVQKNNFIFMDYILRHFANHMDVDLWASIQDTWRSMATSDSPLERMMSTLDFRRAMRDALRDENY